MRLNIIIPDLSKKINSLRRIIVMKKYLAEFIGTFVLTFLACGAASFTAGYQGLLGVVGIALIFGMTVTAMAYSIGNVSGCHINPAVSLGMFVSGRMNVTDLCGYIAAQVLGGIAAGFAMFGITKTFDADILSQYESYGYDLTGLGTNGYGELGGFLQINMWGALIVEIILTFIFVITVIGVTSKAENSNIAGIVIGISLTAVHLFGIPFTGTSVNPARSFGPAIVRAVTGDITPLTQVWVFIVGPLAGALLAAVVYMLLTSEKKTPAEETETIDAEDIEADAAESEVVATAEAGATSEEM
jgi:aquaporin Z